MAELTEEQRKLIDELATSMSKLCHRVIAKRLEQFFEVIGEEVQKLSYHPDPTGKTREPPHCPSCSCGLPEHPRAPQSGEE